MADAKRINQYTRGMQESEKIIVIKHYLIKYIPKEYNDKQLEYALERAEIVAGILAKRRILNAQVLINGAHDFVNSFPKI